MNILVTGCAGFIGFNLSKKLSNNKSIKVIGIDNLNSYYDKKLKISRLKILKKNKNFSFIKCSLENFKFLKKKTKKYKIDFLINLAAQAGVRYSLQKPESYTKSNLVGFANVLEICRIKNCNLIIFNSMECVHSTKSINTIVFCLQLIYRIPELKEKVLASHELMFLIGFLRMS